MTNTWNMKLDFVPRCWKGLYLLQSGTNGWRKRRSILALKSDLEATGMFKNLHLHQNSWSEALPGQCFRHELRMTASQHALWWLWDPAVAVFPQMSIPCQFRCHRPPVHCHMPHISKNYCTHLYTAIYSFGSQRSLQRTSFSENLYQTQMMFNISWYINFFSIYKYLILLLLEHFNCLKSVFRFVPSCDLSIYNFSNLKWIL